MSPGFTLASLRSASKADAEDLRERLLIHFGDASALPRTQPRATLWLRCV